MTTSNTTTTAESTAKPAGFTTFFRAYRECALWASTDDDGDSLEDYDISGDTLASMESDCEAFLRDNGDDIGTQLEQAGHDFFLTRNRHGAGFWDRGIGFYAAGAGRRLTDAAHTYGETNLYVGDDGMVHGD